MDQDIASNLYFKSNLQKPSMLSLKTCANPFHRQNTKDYVKFLAAKNKTYVH